MEIRFWLGVLLAVAVVYSLLFGGSDTSEPSVCRKAATARTQEAREGFAELCAELNEQYQP